MKPTLFILIFLAFTSLALSVPPGPAVAVVSKVILDVQHKEVDRDWTKAQRGETLSSGDRVKTGSKSVAVVKFKDNSLVRVREESELTVTGESRNSAFSKSVNVQKGAVGFNIQKQNPDEEFRFTSPTSVASIRGTGGKFSSHEDSDTLVVTEGVVEFTNQRSSQSVEVRAGFTAISRPDGTIESRPSTPEERSEALQSSRKAEQDNKMEFEFRDNRGNKKELKIDYK